MLIGISGKKQTGKDTVCKIIKALDIWNWKEERESLVERIQEL